MEDLSPGSEVKSSNGSPAPFTSLCHFIGSPIRRQGRCPFHRWRKLRPREVKQLGHWLPVGGEFRAPAQWVPSISKKKKDSVVFQLPAVCAWDIHYLCHIVFLCIHSSFSRYCHFGSRSHSSVSLAIYPQTRRFFVRGGSRVGGGTNRDRACRVLRSTEAGILGQECELRWLPVSPR